MINVTVLTQQSTRSGRLAEYYLDGLDDYHAKDGEASMWQGIGAESLGLNGQIDSEVYKDLLKGRLPTGEELRLSRRNDQSSRVGIDLTFAPPKSVSLQALVGLDERVVRAHDEAVAEVLAHIEQVASQARKKVEGKTYVENTNNLIVAKFRHETNRNTEPHLHTHAVVMNITRRSDGEWRALMNDAIVKNAKVYDTMYTASLAVKLEKEGFNLRREGPSFELAHISRDQILTFSSRSAQVENYLAERGHDRESASATLKNAAAKATRNKKDLSIDRAELFSVWAKDSADLGIDFKDRSIRFENKEIEKAHLAAQNLEKKNNVGKSLQGLSREEIADKAVGFAVRHLTERQSIVGQTALSITATEHALGHVTTTDIAAAVDRAVTKGSLLRSDVVYRAPNDREAMPKTRNEWISSLVDAGKAFSHAKKQVDLAIKSGRLVALEPRYTTQRAVDREQRILNRELAGRSALPPIMSPSAVDTIIEKSSLREDQARAVKLALTSENKILGWQGLAGVGKSYALKDFERAAVAEGYKVEVIAPYGLQVKSLRQDGLNAQTAAAFINSTRRQPLDDKTILCLDEAGVVPTRIMDKLTELVEREGGRLLLLGDIGQTKAIEEGAPFKLLQRAGMQFDVLDEIQRQKNSPTLAASVKLAAAGDAAASVALLDDVREVKDEQLRLNAMATEYASLPSQEREKTLVITGTNESRRWLNERIREELGVPREANIVALARHDSTQEQRRYAHYFHVGDVIQPEANYRSGLKRHEHYDVVDTSGNRVTVKDKDGNMLSFSPAQHRKISVYKPYSIDLGAGDLVRITRNNAALDLTNGDLLKVHKISGGILSLTDGNRFVDMPLSSQMHLEPGYVSTVHASQGLTADRVIGNVATKSKTVADDWWYVMISRAKIGVTLFTDNIKKLPEAISRQSVKHAAIELEHNKPYRIIKNIEKFTNKKFTMD
ncbi:MobF family relaxase [Aeromonas salmonicida]|uniref:MobF family relaxase n=1 Tax=Aeromonas salmonicida TaxID=645 RepID=UPI003CFD1967